MTSADLLNKYEFKNQEVWEEAKDTWVKTGYPLPLKRYKIDFEDMNLSMEEPYFWFLNFLKTDAGFYHIYKTIDTFSAAENSAFFGVSQVRLGGQQDKISQYLATIGKMTKELFQLVRELRIIDERLIYYRESMSMDKEGNKIPDGFKESSEITLKGIWIDMVQGGSKNPASVFGMAREVGFTSLPDLFFASHPKTPEEVDDYIETQRGGFNRAVRTALKRHLKTYLVWRKETYKELLTRRIFTLKYLRQHYEIIKMYMTWVKPYLRHVRRLTLDDTKVLTPDLVSAFEGSMIEVEFLATKKVGKYNACILCHFNYRTRPSMSYQQEGYQRGPIHVGRVVIDIRGYSWTDEQIEAYKKMRDAEDLELIKSVSESVKAAMEALGGELENYLLESEDYKPKKNEEKKVSFVDRFKAEFLSSPNKPKASKPKKADPFKDKKSADNAAKLVSIFAHLAFKNFKKAHGMIMW